MRTITFKQDYKDKQGNQFKAGDKVFLVENNGNLVTIARQFDPKRKQVIVPERYLNL